jgi:hypothetical protein
MAPEAAHSRVYSHEVNALKTLQSGQLKLRMIGFVIAAEAPKSGFVGSGTSASKLRAPRLKSRPIRRSGSTAEVGLLHFSVRYAYLSRPSHVHISNIQ